MPPPHPCPARLQDTAGGTKRCTDDSKDKAEVPAMVDYCLRAMKLFDLFQKLTPAPTGNTDDLAKMASFAHSVQSPIDAEFDVERPVHVTLKDIGCNVIDFMTLMKEMRQHRLELPPRADTFMLQSYPTVLTLNLNVMVKHPKVAVTEIKGKVKGVVATTDIRANSIVTFYPIDLVRIRGYKSNPYDIEASGMAAFFSPYESLRSSFVEHEIRLDDYKYTISNVDIYGKPDFHPNGCCGHMINDGDGPVKAKNNSVLIPLFGGALIAVVAVFDIKQGSEVLASYGAGYWEHRGY